MSLYWSVKHIFLASASKSIFHLHTRYVNIFTITATNKQLLPSPVTYSLLTVFIWWPLLYNWNMRRKHHLSCSEYLFPSSSHLNCLSEQSKHGSVLAGCACYCWASLYLICYFLQHGVLSLYSGRSSQALHPTLSSSQDTLPLSSGNLMPALETGLSFTIQSLQKLKIRKKIHGLACFG